MSPARRATLATSLSLLLIYRYVSYLYELLCFSNVHYSQPLIWFYMFTQNNYTDGGVETLARQARRQAEKMGRAPVLFSVRARRRIRCMPSWSLTAHMKVCIYAHPVEMNINKHFGNRVMVYK